MQLADHVITGEADLKFAEVCRAFVAAAPRADNRAPHLPKIIAAELPEFSRLALPYDFYTDADIAHRIIYVEASRGCPFTCEFCLSSLDIPVRQVPLEKFLAAMQRLLDRGLKQFKFVDRTFNLNIATSRAILEFFLARHQPGMFFHFELIPDRLPAELRAVIAKFPPGSLQFEVGVQTFNPEVGQNISRRQDYGRLADNFNFLRNETSVHIHADLIVGLPGETLESFAAGFDKLIALGPQEIQVGILKRLRGTPIGRHDAEWQMVYGAHPPYEILQNKLVDFATMQRLRRFARYWDLVGNSGNFIETTPLIWSVGRDSRREVGSAGGAATATRRAARRCAGRAGAGRRQRTAPRRNKRNNDGDDQRRTSNGRGSGWRAAAAAPAAAARRGRARAGGAGRRAAAGRRGAAPRTAAHRARLGGGGGAGGGRRRRAQRAAAARRRRRRRRG